MYSDKSFKINTATFCKKKKRRIVYFDFIVFFLYAFYLGLLKYRYCD